MIQWLKCHFGYHDYKNDFPIITTKYSRLVGWRCTCCGYLSPGTENIVRIHLEMSKEPAEDKP